MGIFTKAPVYSQKRMIGNNARKSSVMKKILADKDMAKVLNEPREQREFYKALKSKASGGVTKSELREVLTGFRQGKGKFISGKEGYLIAKKFFKSASNRYSSASNSSSSPGTADIRQSAVPNSSVSQQASALPSSPKVVPAVSSVAVQNPRISAKKTYVPAKNTSASVPANRNYSQNKIKNNPAISSGSQSLKEKKPESSSFSDYAWVNRYSRNNADSHALSKEIDHSAVSFQVDELTRRFIDNPQRGAKRTIADKASIKDAGSYTKTSKRISENSDISKLPG